jgi:hypothetical protein
VGCPDNEKFYGEMRLWGDQMQWEMEQGQLARKRERIGKRVTLTPAAARYGVIVGDKLTGVITDQIVSDAPMAIRQGDDAWIGQVRPLSDTHCEIETVHGKGTFRLDEIELIAFDVPKRDEGQQRAA